LKHLLNENKISFERFLASLYQELFYV